MAEQQDPTIPAFIERAPWSKRIRAYVSCPYCGDAHVHGASDASGNLVLGNRQSHCLVGPGGGYTLIVGPPGMVKPQGRTFRQRQQLLYEDDCKRKVPLREAERPGRFPITDLMRKGDTNA
jgi:hypothetical protein